MAVSNPIAPCEALSLIPRIYAVHRRRRWFGVVLLGQDEIHGFTGFPSREGAIGDARRLAAIHARSVEDQS